MVGPQADVADAGATDDDHEDQIDHGGQHVVPAEGIVHPGQAGVEKGAGLLGKRHGQDQEDQDPGHTAVKDRGLIRSRLSGMAWLSDIQHILLLFW